MEPAYTYTGRYRKCLGSYLAILDQAVSCMGLMTVNGTHYLSHTQASRCGKQTALGEFAGIKEMMMMVRVENLIELELALGPSGDLI